MNCLFTQGISVKFPASLRPSTILPRILIFNSFLPQIILQLGTSPTIEEMVVHIEKIQDLPDGMIDEIVNGFWMKVEGRDRRKQDRTYSTCLEHQFNMAQMEWGFPDGQNEFSPFL
jgi:hypothetical protein